MADDDPSGGRVAKEWPVEGHLLVPGSGLVVRTDCLGRSFTSRVTTSTASYGLTIGLPQLDPGSTPPGPLIPPEWTVGLSDENEEADEATHWGVTRRQGDAVVFRCRFYTTVTASDHEEFLEVSGDFGAELTAWWKHFTSWVGILASQDLLGSPEWDWRRREIIGPDQLEWTSDGHGQRAVFYSGAPKKRVSDTFRILELHDLEACATAAGNQGPPPVEWLLIRDARSEANAGWDLHANDSLRRAVIDAATAAELAMTALIDKYLDDANALEPVRKALARSSMNLGGKKEVLNLLRPGLLHNRVQNDLINKRNGASHRGEQYDEDETQAALDIATAIVESAYPLASLLPTSGEGPPS
jgi:hypothetical protein